MKRCRDRKPKRSLKYHQDRGNFKTHRPSRQREKLRAIEHSVNSSEEPKN